MSEHHVEVGRMKLDQEVLNQKLKITVMTKIREAVAEELQHAAYLAVDGSDSKRIWDYRTQRLAEYDEFIKELGSDV